MGVRDRALAVIVVWLVTGPIFHFSDTWQLVINTGTTIVTFLMVFLIQRAQNKDSLAVQLKLNEIVAAIAGREQPPDRRRGAERGRAEASAPVLFAAGGDGEERGRPAAIALDRGGRDAPPPQARRDAAAGATSRRHTRTLTRRRAAQPGRGAQRRRRVAQRAGGVQLRRRCRSRGSRRGSRGSRPRAARSRCAPCPRACPRRRRARGRTRRSGAARRRTTDTPTAPATDWALASARASPPGAWQRGQTSAANSDLACTPRT